IGQLLAGDVRGRAVYGLEHAGVGAVRVDVAGCCQSDASADRGGQVGHDVAEEVVGDDYVKSTRIGDHEDSRRVDVQIVDHDIRMLGRDRVDRALPERAG